MPVNTISAAVHITPTVIKTFFKHYRRKVSKYVEGDGEEEVTDDVLYDEAFHIVKAFIELGTRNTVESLQEFTNTHIPSPPWAAVSPVMVPLKVCNKAADALIEWFSDPDELRNIVGGKKWWQVRGLDGVEGEWVTERSLLRDGNTTDRIKRREEELSRPLTSGEADIVRMNNLETVMLYIHGDETLSGFSLRRLISRNEYRGILLGLNQHPSLSNFEVWKAPQYPWPCALQDCLAAYLYLVNPCRYAFHDAISSERIVVAGDSSGGGLCISLLAILRDLGRSLPAGGVLISPWVDLTHSFPSIMENTSTDIIPQHGFIHKPSTVWPVDARPSRASRLVPSESPPPPKPGHPDTLLPSESRISREHSSKKDSHEVISQEEMLDSGGDAKEENDSVHVDHKRPDEELARSWYPKPPKVLMEDSKAVPLELRSQIQLYATNGQLTHPLVSPVLQGSLGNLCPLYIIAGDDECLRDEIIYMAHRAAYPEEFPARKESVEESSRQLDNVHKFKDPTKVHLQVFDGMCHVPTVFTFHKAVKYAYRSIAEFVKHVTSSESVSRGGAGFPELVKNGTDINKDSNPPEVQRSPGIFSRIGNGLKSLSTPLTFGSSDKSSTAPFDLDRSFAKEHIQENPSLNKLAVENRSEKGEVACKVEDSDPNILMIRERVNIYGRVRQMEDKKDIPCLRLRLDEIGLLREAPARRWLAGQQEWDSRFKHAAKTVEKRRKKEMERYEKALARAQALNLVHDPIADGASVMTDSTVEGNDEGGKIQWNRRWGPLDLDDEDPPPSGIAGRRDTPESLALLKKILYHTAPRTIKRMPKRKTKDVMKAALSPEDDPHKFPRQSVSEQQHKAEIVPVHGLSLWSSIMAYFTKRSSAQAAKGKHKTASGMKKIRVGFTKRKERRSRRGSIRMDRRVSSSSIPSR